MPFERWGSLSVDDHVDTDSLITNVLLYDRLVLPMMTAQPDRDELAFWYQKDWRPALQQERAEQLGDLAVKRPWNPSRRQQFRSRYDELKAEAQDAAHLISGQAITRLILAQEGAIEKPIGVHGATVVAAYSSGESFERDFYLGDDHQAQQAYLLSRRLAIPDLKDPEKALQDAIALSRDTDFRKKRAALFDWQALAAAGPWSPQDTVERIAEMSDDYNQAVRKAFKAVRWKFAFTVFGIAAGFAFGGPAGAAAGAALSVARFALLDRKPAIPSGSLEPVAMFHEMKNRLGIELT